MGSCLRWLFTHGRAAVHDCLSLSSCADERRTDHMAILPPTLHPHRTTIFIFMILYSTLPMLWGQLNEETSLKDLSRIFLNFPTLAGHLWFMYPLISLYLFIPIISPWLKKPRQKKNVFHRIVLIINMYTLSKPLVR